MMPVGRFTIAADHPSLAGHFPGRPVVPGVMLLDRALIAIQAARSFDRVAGLPAVKFTRPVLPGQEVVVACGEAQDGRIAFACTVDGAAVAHGSLRVGSV